MKRKTVYLCGVGNFFIHGAQPYNSTYLNFPTEEEAHSYARSLITFMVKCRDTERIADMVKYMPGGIEYLAAETRFTDAANQ